MKVSIVGCGHMARVHIPYILKVPGVQLATLCDKNEIRAKELAQRYGLAYYTNLSQMLDKTRPHVVHILTPPQTHAVLAILALEAGCHVLVEKPLCLITEEADTIYEAAQSAERLVSVNHTLLWSPLVKRAQKVVNSGRLGRVLNIQYIMGDNYLEAVKRGYRRWAKELRGGAFCDLIPHPLSLIRAFLPDAKVISAQAKGFGIRDLCELWVYFSAKGAGASLWMSMNQRPLEHNLRIYCTRGTVHIDLRTSCLAVVPDRGLPGPIARVISTISESKQLGIGTLGNTSRLLLRQFDPRGGTAKAIDAFYQAIAKGKSSPVSQEEARAIVELSEAIWDTLEETPGTICLPVDGKGRTIEHKTPCHFASIGRKGLPKVMVNGGTGFIGSHLVQQLVSDGRQVRVFCRPTSCLDHLPTEGVELAFGDVEDFNSVHRAMEGIEVLFHLAATMSGDWASNYLGTVVGTRNVLEAAAKARVKKVIYVSSLGVLHASLFTNGGRVDESFPVEQRPRARGNYSRAKLQAEDVARKFAETGKQSICIIRPGLVYGPGRSEFLPDAGFRVSNRLALVVGMDGRRLPLTYVKNLVDAILLAERCENSCGRVYHIVDPDQPTVREYIQAYQRFTRQRLTAIYLPTYLWTAGCSLIDGLLRLLRGTSPNLSYRLRSIARGPWFDVTAANEELGWKARVSFEEGASQTYKPEYPC